MMFRHQKEVTKGSALMMTAFYIFSRLHFVVVKMASSKNSLVSERSQPYPLRNH